MTTTSHPPQQAVSTMWRDEILSFAAHLLPETERHHAALITSTAAPLLEWAAQGDSEDDVRSRMRAMRQQNKNTPPACLAMPDNPRRWVQVPALTVDQFLAEARELYAFIAAERG
jgi:hypothetical protein